MSFVLEIGWLMKNRSDWSDTFEKKRREEKWGNELLNSLSTGAFCATKEIEFVALKFGISFWKIPGPTWVPIPMGLEPLIFWS